MKEQFTDFQIDRAQTLKRVSDSLEIAKRVYEDNDERPVTLRVSKEVIDAGEVPVTLIEEVTVNPVFIFGQYLCQRSLKKDLESEGMIEDAEDIIQASREKHIIFNKRAA